uniref:Portal protein n=1 Tax=viral metagenome TaxID=1070528 RepID=A0A6M3IFC0_9ZZZZ
MPNIIRGEEISNRSKEFIDKNFDYDYPFGLNLDPKEELHKNLINKIMKYAQEAAGNISTRYDSWNEIDRTLTAYIEIDDKEQEVIYNDPRKPVSIVFPNTYAIMETIQAYLVAAFYQDPIFQFEGVGPEDIIGSIMMEKVIDLHCNKLKVGLDLHTLFRDALAYGIGIVSPVWKVEEGFRTVMREQTGLMGLFQKRVKGVEQAILFEGNGLENIDPYLALPDPNVSIHKVQDGEFFGWVERTNYSDLLSKEKVDNDYFNVKYVNSMHSKHTSIYGYDKSDRYEKWIRGKTNRYHTEPGAGSPIKGGMATKPCDVIHMYVKLIPKEWKIGDGEYPEKWLFSVAADSVIVRAKPLDLDHNKFPVAIAAPDFDGYSAIPVSRLEMLNGLQRVLDWMFNMHIANVRKTINDVLIYDPYLINSKDINSPEAGKRIRIRRPGWGRPDIAKGSVFQLPVTDVTRQHVGDSSWIVQWMQKIGAADDVMMGALRQGGPERLSKAEFQGTQFGQLSRLGRIARIIGMQAMQDVGEFFASHTQQLMTEEQYIKITGRWQNVLLQEYGASAVQKGGGRLKVTPFDVLVKYDLKVRDGSIPGGNYSDVWTRLFEIISKTPELYEKFDVTRIFMHIARNNGAKDVQSFVRTKVVPDEVADLEQQKGNMIPINQAFGEGMI